MHNLGDLDALKKDWFGVVDKLVAARDPVLAAEGHARVARLRGAALPDRLRRVAVGHVDEVHAHLWFRRLALARARGLHAAAVRRH